MKRKLFDRSSIPPFSSILPILAISLVCSWNPPGKAQTSENAGLIDDVTVRPKSRLISGTTTDNPVGGGSPTDLNVANRLNKPALTHEQPPIDINAVGAGSPTIFNVANRLNKPAPTHEKHPIDIGATSRLKPTANLLSPGLIDDRAVRRGINSPSHSESRLKPTANLLSLELTRDRTVRRGITSPSHSESRLKPTAISTDNPLHPQQNPLSNFPVSQSVPPSNNIRQGRQVSINGRIIPLAWTQQPTSSTSTNIRTWIADVGLMQSAGVDLLNTADSTRQPVQWFAVSLTEARSLVARATATYRYLDVTDFARQAGWQISVSGNTLRITSQTARISGIRQAPREWGDRIVVDLDRPAPWQVNFGGTPSPSPTPAPRDTPDDPTKPAPAQPHTVSPLNPETRDDPSQPALPVPVAPAATITGQEWSIALDAQIAPALIQRAFQTSKQVLSLKVEPAGNQTRVRVTIPLGWRPQVFSLGNPNRLVIDIRPDSLVEKDILWARGVRWRQQYQNLGTARFPVVSLEVNPRQTGVIIRPLLSNPPTDRGTAPLLQTAELAGTAAAINAGFFNRINRLALGAIRRDNKWLAGPILNRGAVAWNDRGEFIFDRLTLQETVITPAGQRLPISHLNSAYVQSGIGRYTPDWGTTYTPFSDNEIVVTVTADRVISQSPGGAAGQTNFPIPANGYILAWRSNLSPAAQLAAGTLLRVETNTIPGDFNRFPYILGGGPVLVKNSRIVLDARAEGFSDAYVRQTAIRSAIGRTAAGNLLIVAVHNRAGGAGPNFAELAQILQQMGAVEAVNLDGGSSTSLYLGGSLLDRPPSTAARVHNAIGIFIQP